MNIPVIDFEASGLHAKSYPIEVAIYIDGETRSWLIRPEPKWLFWCNTAEKLHGISRETLFKEGLAASDVVAGLNAFLADFNGEIYSDAHLWDADWLSKLYRAAKQRPPSIIASIYDLLSTEEAAQFNKSKNELGAEERFRLHRAESDVRLIAEAYNQARQ